MLKIKDVSKSYGSNRVVNNISLDIKKGKLTSFVGPMVRVKVLFYQ
ncbi:Putative ferrichrome ABC transporter ATP-binding protein, partial [Candidatus Arthromitus sp. SFB-2]